MSTNVLCSNPQLFTREHLLRPVEGGAVHLAVIMVAVEINPISHQYETGPVADSSNIASQDWKSIWNFHFISQCYDRHCPQKKYSKTWVNILECPW